MSSTVCFVSTGPFAIFQKLLRAESILTLPSITFSDNHSHETIYVYIYIYECIYNIDRSISVYINTYLPGTQMTTVLIGNLALFWRGHL